MLSRMKSAKWLIACPILMVIGVVCLFQGVGEGAGNAAMNFGWPLPANHLAVVMKSEGGWTLTFYLLELAALISFVTGIVSLLRSNSATKSPVENSA
jgi:hypothetical protein